MVQGSNHLKKHQNTGFRPHHWSSHKNHRKRVCRASCLFTFVICCRRYKKKRSDNRDPNDNIYSVAAAIDEGSVIYADIRPPSNPYHSIVLPEYSQIDKTKKISENKSNGDIGITRSDSDLIVHENSLYRSTPINIENNESGSDSDEIFEENEVYASSVDLHGDEESEAANEAKVTSEHEIEEDNADHGYYNLPAPVQETSHGSGYENVTVGDKPVANP